MRKSVLLMILLFAVGIDSQRTKKFALIDMEYILKNIPLTNVLTNS